MEACLAPSSLVSPAMPARTKKTKTIAPRRRKVEEVGDRALGRAGDVVAEADVLGGLDLGRGVEGVPGSLALDHPAPPRRGIFEHGRRRADQSPRAATPPHGAATPARRQVLEMLRLPHRPDGTKAARGGSDVNLSDLPAPSPAPHRPRPRPPRALRRRRASATSSGRPSMPSPPRAACSSSRRRAAASRFSYQLPAVMIGGTALVISPLIALMEDQVRALSARGVPARPSSRRPLARARRTPDASRRSGAVTTPSSTRPPSGSRSRASSRRSRRERALAGGDRRGPLHRPVGPRLPAGLPADRRRARAPPPAARHRLHSDRDARRAGRDHERPRLGGGEHARRAPRVLPGPTSTSPCGEVSGPREAEHGRPAPCSRRWSRPSAPRAPRSCTWPRAGAPSGSRACSASAAGTRPSTHAGADPDHTARGRARLRERARCRWWSQPTRSVIDRPGDAAGRAPRSRRRRSEAYYQGRSGARSGTAGYGAGSCSSRGGGRHRAPPPALRDRRGRRAREPRARRARVGRVPRAAPALRDAA